MGNHIGGNTCEQASIVRATLNERIEKLEQFLLEQLHYQALRLERLEQSGQAPSADDAPSAPSTVEPIAWFLAGWRARGEQMSGEQTYQVPHITLDETSRAMRDIVDQAMTTSTEDPGPTGPVGTPGPRGERPSPQGNGRVCEHGFSCAHPTIYRGDGAIMEWCDGPKKQG